MSGKPRHEFDVEAAELLEAAGFSHERIASAMHQPLRRIQYALLDTNRPPRELRIAKLEWIRETPGKAESECADGHPAPWAA